MVGIFTQRNQLKCKKITKECEQTSNNELKITSAFLCSASVSDIQFNIQYMQFTAAL